MDGLSIAFASRLSFAIRSSIALGVAPGKSFANSTVSYDFAERSIRRIRSWVVRLFVSGGLWLGVGERALCGHFRRSRPI